MGILNKIFGDPNEKVLKEIMPIVETINTLEGKYKNLSDDELLRVTAGFRQKLKVKDLAQADTLEEEKEKLNQLLPDAFAAVREASRRVINHRHFDVQLIGGIVLHQGKIAEMKTGEGKTLVANLPLYLNALAGKGVHLITVNDYLAKVGAGWMGPVFHALGMSVGVIVHESGLVYDPEYNDETQYDERLRHFRPVERKEAYATDITYGTNNEYGFDYLRDNMAPSRERQVQRDLYYAIVDEIDSILIDEARTPLIISAPAEESGDKYFKFAQLVQQLNEGEDYNVDEKMRAATLTEGGIQRMEKFLGIENIYTSRGIEEVHHIEQALKAHALFHKEKDYVVKDGEVIIVDEFTGRLMNGRRYSEGLHQAIEAKEGVKVQRESTTLATITFQNYFRIYKKLSGMTGTAVTEAEEFSKIYQLDTVIIPTNMTNVRHDLNDLIYKTEEGKFQAVIAEVKRRQELGQPILVGTISIAKNELLADMMERQGLRPNVLNAKNHEKEAKFIADAGKIGTITIATNMAGRGVDIMLGGNKPDKESPEYAEWQAEHDKVLATGGLHVIGTERHESRRIDNQLRGRAGRQGDAGSSQFFVSMDDDLMRIFGGDRMKSIMTTLNVPEDMPIENKLISKSIESAQKKVEGNNFDIRKHLVEYDDVLNKHRDAIYRKRREILSIAEKKKNLDSASPDEQEPAQESTSTLSDMIMQYVENEIEQVVSFHTAPENISDWNLTEISDVIKTIFPVDTNLQTDLSKYTAGDNYKLDKARARTEIIDHLLKAAKETYSKMSKLMTEAGIDWNEIEKSVLVRSIDSLWVEHLEAISSMRQGIGLRGYGQRDPLIEYKKEAYLLYNELNSLIQKEVAYSIFKLGSLGEVGAKAFAGPDLMSRAKQFSAPAKEAGNGSSSFSAFATPGGPEAGADAIAKFNSALAFSEPKKKELNEEGEKLGRNDPCPCGSGKKYKKCCGK